MINLFLVSSVIMAERRFTNKLAFVVIDLSYK